MALDRRHRGNDIRAAAVHPGGIRTELVRHVDPIHIQKMIEQLASEGKAPFQLKAIPQGAATSVWAAVVASAEEIGGQYCENFYVGRVVPDHVTISATSEGVRGDLGVVVKPLSLIRSIAPTKSHPVPGNS